MNRSAFLVLFFCYFLLIFLFPNIVKGGHTQQQDEAVLFTYSEGDFKFLHFSVCFVFFINSVPLSPAFNSLGIVLGILKCSGWHGPAPI